MGPVRGVGHARVIATAKARPLALGVYVPDVGAGLPAVAALERRLAGPVEIVSVYYAWGLGRRRAIFDEIEAIVAAGRIPLVTWEPWGGEPGAGRHPSDAPAYALKRILHGDYDAYVDWWADRLARVEAPVYLRPMHEMNGEWYPWCGGVNGNVPADYAAVWRHLHDRFRRRGTANVRWVWSPYARSVPDGAHPALAAYYPGEPYVDALALDGYNWGATRPWSCWETFTALFERAYEELCALGPQPVLLAEVGCAEAGGDKPAWIRDAFAALTSRYDRVCALVWFDVNKECDWRLESSPASFTAFRLAVTHRIRARKRAPRIPAAFARVRAAPPVGPGGPCQLY